MEREIAEMNEIEKRMDRFDSVVHEYLRSKRRTVEYLAAQIGCNPSSLWRYRKKVEYFERVPLCILSGCFRCANISNEDIRYILGLPTGKPDEK